MKGFVTGSLALIILYVVVQAGTSSKLDSASKTSTSLLKRALSPGVAGIGNHNKVPATPATKTTALPGIPNGPFYNV